MRVTKEELVHAAPPEVSPGATREQKVAAMRYAFDVFSVSAGWDGDYTEVVEPVAAGPRQVAVAEAVGPLTVDGVLDLPVYKV